MASVKNRKIAEAEQLLQLMRQQLGLAWREKMEAELILLRTRPLLVKTKSEWKKV